MEIIGQRSPDPTTTTRTSTTTTLLNNFSTLPCFNVTWGAKKALAFVKPLDDHPVVEADTDNEYHPPTSRTRKTDDSGIGAVREKLLSDYRTELHQMQAAFLSHTVTPNPEVVVTDEKVVAAADLRPWNLRTRRAVCKDPNNCGNGSNSSVSAAAAAAGGNGGEKRVGFSPRRRSVYGCGQEEGKGKRAKFSVSLSRAEIEEDFLVITGNRPARRPKKRPRNVQKQIDGLFPGYWLTEVTADMYKVEEPVEGGKR